MRPISSLQRYLRYNDTLAIEVGQCRFSLKRDVVTFYGFHIEEQEWNDGKNRGKMADYLPALLGNKANNGMILRKSILGHVTGEYREMSYD